MRKTFIAGVAALALAAGMGAISAGVSSAQTVNQACAPSGPNDYFSAGSFAGLQATCQLTASTQLNAPNTVFMLPADSTSSAIDCQGVASASYTTQGTVTAAPPTLNASNVGQPVCELSVISGFAPAGSYLGSETISLVSPPPSGSVQLTAYLCGDPSCATGALNLNLTPAPAALVTINNGGSVSSAGVASGQSNGNPSPSPDYNQPNRCFHAAGTDNPC